MVQTQHANRTLFASHRTREHNQEHLTTADTAGFLSQFAWSSPCVWSLKTHVWEHGLSHDHVTLQPIHPRDNWHFCQPRFAMCRFHHYHLSPHQP